MPHYAIVTDLNRCVQCLSCSVACKMANNVGLATFWNKVLRIGPHPIPGGSGQFPDVEYYSIPVGCQHCENPSCVDVCPTGATYKREDGIVAIDADVCIGCQACMSACPYGVRSFVADKGVVEKCTLCEGKVADGDLPECVRQCQGRARFFGDLDEGIESFRGPKIGSEETDFLTIVQTSKEWTEDQVHTLPDEGTAPSFRYILRNRTWYGAE